MTKWSTLKFQWFKDFQVWVFLTLYLFIFQIILILTFKEQIHIDSGFTEIISAIGMGLRFDGAAAASVVLIFFLSSISTLLFNWGDRLHKFRLIFFKFAIIIFTILCGIDLVFFYEYGDQFNQMVFGLTDDDTKAIIITVWKEYHPIRFIFLISITAYVALYLAKKWIAYTPALIQENNKHHPHLLIRSMIFTMVFLSFVFVARGLSLTSQPLRQHHAFITKDMFLNKTILTPLAALRYAIIKRINAQGENALSSIWPEQDLTKALEIFTGKNYTDIDQAIKNTIVKENKTKPKHIFLILMESHSGWTVWPEYRHLNFSPQLSALANNGIYFKNFVPSASGTMRTLNVLFTGLPFSGLSVNYETSALKPYPFSIAKTFKRMGYRTRFYYGGFLGWQRVDNFAEAQGFDELHGGGTMANGTTAIETNEWGINDGNLFNYVSNDIDDDVPSFNLILTTSNHPPYDLDLTKEGFTNHSLGDDISQTKKDSMTILGHLWYADNMLGKFVRAIENKLTNPLFAITGDHTTHAKPIFKNGSAFQHIAVPFVLYGPKVLNKVDAPLRSGSHMDILPTLYTLAAPKNFEYYAFGENLLSGKSLRPTIGPGYTINKGNLQIGKHHFPLYEGAQASSKVYDVNLYHRAAQAISWYRVRKGKDIQ